MQEANTNTEECQELKNIKYKTMLLNGSALNETKSSNDLSNLDKFLETEKINNSNEPWCKLNKTIKTKKLIEFVSVYCTNNNMTEDEAKQMNIFFKECLDKKKLSRVKDVNYDKENGLIKDIPSLSYIKTSKHFTLKNLDKRVSTLKSLTPKKTNGTIKHKIQEQTKPSESDTDDE